MLETEGSRLVFLHLLQWNGVGRTHLTQVAQLEPEGVELAEVRLPFIPPALLVEKGKNVLEGDAIVSVHVHHLEPEPVALALHAILCGRGIERERCRRC